jgi:hypothetical protein
LIADWVQSGAPEGDPAELPEPRTFTAGWQLPSQPDLVIPMADKPVDVAGDAPLRYQYFRVDPKLTEDRWIQAIEVQPGNRAVVHHILVFAVPPRAEGDRVDRGEEFDGGVRGFLAGYVPGLRSQPFPPGTAKFLAAGSELIFQIHYTPNGTAQQDLSRLGLVFSDPAQVRYEVRTVSAFQPNLRIPKHQNNHKEKTKTRLGEPMQLLGLMPHLHLRGKSFQYLLRRPGEEQWEMLLDVPQYDFNWQTSYRLADPIDLPADSYIQCIAHYDNSEKNLTIRMPTRMCVGANRLGKK